MSCLVSAKKSQLLHLKIVVAVEIFGRLDGDCSSPTDDLPPSLCRECGVDGCGLGVDPKLGSTGELTGEHFSDLMTPGMKGLWCLGVIFFSFKVI